jgi:hypothetical protein
MEGAASPLSGIGSSLINTSPTEMHFYSENSRAGLSQIAFTLDFGSQLMNLSGLLQGPG